MSDPITKKLKALQSIQPHRRYAEDLKQVLLSRIETPTLAARFGIRQSVASGLTLVLASAFVILLLAGGAYIEKLATPLFLPGLHSDSLSQEYDTMNIQIKIAEAQYYNKTPQTVSVALDETGNNTPNHLNVPLIQNESRSINVEDPRNAQIDDVLNKLL